MHLTRDGHQIAPPLDRAGGVGRCAGGPAGPEAGRVGAIEQVPDRRDHRGLVAIHAGRIAFARQPQRAVVRTAGDDAVQRPGTVTISSLCATAWAVSLMAKHSMCSAA
jgi:hypothetical protein